MNLDEMTVKELKELAVEQGIKHQRNASKAKMLELIKEHGEQLLKEVEKTVELVTEEPEVSVEEPEREKIYAGICAKTGKKLYL